MKILQMDKDELFSLIVEKGQVARDVDYSVSGWVVNLKVLVSKYREATGRTLSEVEQEYLTQWANTEIPLRRFVPPPPKEAEV